MELRRKRCDTSVRSIEQIYGMDFHVRGDMKLGALLRERGYDSLSHLLRAYRGQLTDHPRTRSAFLSFHTEDLAKVQGLKLMTHNPHLNLLIDYSPSRRAVNSTDSTYIRQALSKRIQHSDVLICMIGNGTGWRDWVDWELKTAIDSRVPICAIRIPDSFGRTPEVLKSLGVSTARWGRDSIVAEVERAIARGI